MTKADIVAALKTAKTNFEKNYPEWEDYTLELDENKVIVKNSDNQIIKGSAADELLRDFASELKENELMIVTSTDEFSLIDEYYYEVEEGLEDLADEIEAKLGKKVTNLRIELEDNKPIIKFKYLGNMMSDEKEKVVTDIKSIAESYEAVDEDDIFADIEFDDFDEVIEEIEEEDLADEIEEDTKAEDSDFRIVETGLTGKRNREILDSVIGQMSDGIWENSPSVKKYWQNVEVSEIDGKIVLNINQRWDSGYYDKSDDEVRRYFANKIKQIVKEEIKDGLHADWSRNDESVVTYLGYELKITVADAYAAYDALLGRKTRYVNWEDAVEDFKGMDGISSELLISEDPKSEEDTLQLINKHGREDVENTIWSFYHKLNRSIDEEDATSAIAYFMLVYHSVNLIVLAEDNASFEDIINNENNLKKKIEQIPDYYAADSIDDLAITLEVLGYKFIENIEGVDIFLSDYDEEVQVDNESKTVYKFLNDVPVNFSTHEKEALQDSDFELNSPTDV